MYIIQPKVVGDYSSNDKLNNLLDAIDTKIVYLARCKSANIQYDTMYEPNMDLYDDLTTYRKILLDKLLGCNCIDDQRLIKITTKLNKLTR